MSPAPAALRRWHAPLFLAVSLLLPAAALAADQPRAHQEVPPAGEPESPRLDLEASPRIGFRPLKVTLIGTLHGVSRDDDNFCHVDQLWIGRRASEPETRERTSARRPRCQHPADQRSVERRFYKDLTFSTPGQYTYRLVLEPKEGRPVVSKPVTIQVLAR